MGILQTSEVRSMKAGQKGRAIRTQRTQGHGAEKAGNRKVGIRD